MMIQVGRIITMNDKTISQQNEIKIQKNIQDRVLKLESYNNIHKDFTKSEMVDKIKKIIESEVNKK